MTCCSPRVKPFFDLNGPDCIQNKGGRWQKYHTTLGEPINYMPVIDLGDLAPKNPMAPILPYTWAIIAVLLGSSLPGLKTWRMRVLHPLVWGACMALDKKGYFLLALSVAITLNVWTYLPGSFQSLNLPSHASFMRRLRPLPPNEDGTHEECMVCWDTKHAIAELPCKHQACVGCLQLMGQHCQTACPVCKNALFSNHDYKIFILTKTSVAFSLIVSVLYLLSAIKHGLEHSWLSLFSSCCLLFINSTYMWIVGRSIRESGENWWRSFPGSERLHYKSSLFNVGMNAFSLFMTLFNMRDFFD